MNCLGLHLIDDVFDLCMLRPRRVSAPGTLLAVKSSPSNCPQGRCLVPKHSARQDNEGNIDLPRSLEVYATIDVTTHTWKIMKSNF